MSGPFPSRLACIMALMVTSLSPLAVGGEKKNLSPCDKPREIVSAPKLSKEEQEKARKIRAQGFVNISINEEGDVVEANVVRASSGDAVELLLAYAKSMKFKPRPTCGTTHTAVNYTLAGR